jgi:hypothetical protein
MKITDEQIAEVMGHFDFEKVAKIYEMLGWKWRGEPVTKDALVSNALRLLKDLQNEYPDVSAIETGGLRASVYEEEGYDITQVKLIFIAHQAIA